jgi:acetylornithine deacetylase/succinyl-diaminopimelate desuccinylase-like protein
LFQIKQDINALLSAHLTLQSEDGWQSQARFPFIQVGTPGIYNITPDTGMLGVEIRSIPADRLSPLVANLEKFCKERQLSLHVSVMEDGVACNPELSELKLLLNSVEQLSRQKVKIGKKLPGTSARFAPGGQGIVWGQSGIGPHTSAERHYIPSILPYYETLNTFAHYLSGGNIQG